MIKGIASLFHFDSQQQVHPDESNEKEQQSQQRQQQQQQQLQTENLSVIPLGPSSDGNENNNNNNNPQHADASTIGVSNKVQRTMMTINQRGKSRSGKRITKSREGRNNQEKGRTDGGKDVFNDNDSTFVCPPKRHSKDGWRRNLELSNVEHDKHEKLPTMMR